jgi:glycogen debranching enzyme
VADAGNLAEMAGLDVEHCYEQALALLRRSDDATGFVASPALPHYRSVWTRDAAFTALGALASGDERLIDGVRRTLRTLAMRQSKLGQIPSAYWPQREYWDWGESGSTDATSLFIITASKLHEVARDDQLVGELRVALERAATWLSYQDANNFGLIDSPEAADWMDSSLNRSGKVFYNNVLFAHALDSIAALAPSGRAVYEEQARWTKEKINLLFWPSADRRLDEVLAHVPRPPTSVREFPHPAAAAAFAAAASDSRSHYLTHVQFGRFVDRCDVLANLLAVLWGIAEGDRASRILEYLEESDIDQPYPVRCWPEAIGEGDASGMWKLSVERFQHPRWRNQPWTYHNAAIWPFIGGLYVVALSRHGRKERARAALMRLAEANQLSAGEGEWGFHEWLHGRTGEPGGASQQTWNAGTYVLAYHVLAGHTAIV